MRTPLAPHMTAVDRVKADAMPRRVGRTWLWPDGTVLPVVAGGSGGQGSGGDSGTGAGDGGAGDGASGSGDGGTGGGAGDGAGAGGPGASGNAGTGAGDDGDAGLSKAGVDRAKREARKAAIDEVAKTLGCTVEEAKAIVEERRQAQEAEKTDAQKAREAADREKAEAAEEKRATARERRELRTERALLKAKVADNRLDKAVRLVLADLGDDADEAAVAEAVEKFATDTPEWFGEADRRRVPGSDPQGRGPGGGGGGQKTGLEAGRERAIARRAKVPEANADPLGSFAKIG